jgi:hypothetical protein
VPRPPQSRSCPSYYFYTSCGRGGLTPEGSSGCVQRRPRDTSQDRPPPEAEWQLELRGHRRPWRRTRTSATATGEGVSHSVPMFVDVQGLLTPKWFGAASGMECSRVQEPTLVDAWTSVATSRASAPVKVTATRAKVRNKPELFRDSIVLEQPSRHAAPLSNRYRHDNGNQRNGQSHCGSSSRRPLDRSWSAWLSVSRLVKVSISSTSPAKAPPGSLVDRSR